MTTRTSARSIRQSALLPAAVALCAAFSGSSGAAQDGEASSFAGVPKSGTTRFEPARNEERVPRQFQLSDHTFSYEAEYVRSSGPVRVYKVRFPSPVRTKHRNNNTVHAHYFQPAGAGPFPGVVVLHILGGDFALSQTVANSLARKGIAALFVKMPYYGERGSPDAPRRMVTRDPRQTVAGMTQGVLDIRRAAAWLADRPEVDRDRLGITGISLGGIMSALSAAAEPRFQKVAIYLGGGNLGEMVWRFDHRDAEKFRDQWIAEGGSRESFLETLKPVDPATYGHLLKDRKVLMVAARHDEIIPRESTLALWESIGRRPELVWLDAGHISAILYLYGEMERLGTFFGGCSKN